MMRVMAAGIAAICAVMIMMTWNTALALTWTVALAGWLPHVFHKQGRTIEQS